MLKILFAEIGGVSSNNVEKLAHHRCDTGEMTGTCLAFHLVAEGWHIHHRLHRLRIHVADRWRKKIIDIRSAQQSGIPFQIARIFVEVFIRAELQRINEDRHDGHVIFCSGAMNQFKMAFMEVAHGRHEADAFSRPPCWRQNLTQFLNGADDLHEVLLAARICWPRVLQRQLKYDNCRGKNAVGILYCVGVVTAPTVLPTARPKRSICSS